ncbi:hypothetical protein FNH05_06465 [Amycolatopsis rhizosphaerae]|uniref:Uncharacterized protein n=1 Tax=Amycolatopsis rhizosphaerae TaxID=2053003 RepID=A0A558DBP2_9PSEU|nr:hypothetical protein [Amycolatopsis rhizosphaerae]TVT58447.1 hypothetical protein FNH05_06465 [Amycolatopsis rhizosphaerae]
MDALPELVLNTAADPARRNAWLGFHDSQVRLDPPRLHLEWPGGQGELHVFESGAGSSRAELRVACEAGEVAARMLDALADQVNENFNPD